MDFVFKDKYDLNDLKAIMKLLRGKDGCPWDRVQTHESIRKNFIEETYEAIEAIDKKDSALLREELGDVLLQIVFHSEMEEEAGRFSFDDVANDICQKLIVRHPHVFGETRVSGVDDVLTNWNAIKQKTKGQKTASETLESVPMQLPALMRSQKVQSRVAKAGFDYPDAAMAMDDLCEEVRELDEAMGKQDFENIAEELGDVLFSAVNVARLLNLDSEEVLTDSCNKFICRFKCVEKLAEKEGVSLKDSDIDTLNGLWKEAKKRIQGEKIPHEEY